MKRLAPALLLGLLALVAVPRSAFAGEGRVVYAARCSNCHGPEGRGKATFAIPTLAGSTLSADEMAKVIASGRARMPPFAGKLTPEQIKAVAGYVKTELASQR